MAKKILLANAFSLNMLGTFPASIKVESISPEAVPETAESVIGHPDTARVVSGILKREVQPNRTTVSVGSGDIIYVAQYRGPRLPEGATDLPEGATLEFLKVTIE